MPSEQLLTCSEVAEKARALLVDHLLHAIRVVNMPLPVFFDNAYGALAYATKELGFGRGGSKERTFEQAVGGHGLLLEFGLWHEVSVRVMGLGFSFWQPFASRAVHPLQAAARRKRVSPDVDGEVDDELESDEDDERAAVRRERREELLQRADDRELAAAQLPKSLRYVAAHCLDGDAEAAYEQWHGPGGERAHIAEEALAIICDGVGVTPGDRDWAAQDMGLWLDVRMHQRKHPRIPDSYVVRRADHFKRLAHSGPDALAVLTKARLAVKKGLLDCPWWEYYRLRNEPAGTGGRRG